MTTYKEIRRITGNNKVYAEAALQTLTETCWWVAEKASDVVYLRDSNNDWVAIPDAYTNEIGINDIEFTTVNGKSVYLNDNGTSSYTAIEAE